MKKLLFGLLVTVIISFNSTAQTSKESWRKMIENHKVNVDRVLNSEKPKDVELNKFREQLILGERKLSEKSNFEIAKSSEPLKKYAMDFIKKNDILVENEDEILFYASFYPDFPINDDLNEAFGGLTIDEVWDCAVEAVGLGFMTAIGAAGIKATGIIVFTKTITKVITKFAGPIGGAITAADFAFCLYGQSLD